MDVSDLRHALVALPMGMRLCAHCTGDWEGRRASLDGCGEEKVSRTHRSSNPEF
jgi:hypothetical protein